MAAQFLLLSIPDNARAGGTVKVIAAAQAEDAINAKLQNLDATVLGRVALVEVRQMYERRPAVNNVPVEGAVIEGDH